jgi:long-chain fatty acid transport protein
MSEFDEYAGLFAEQGDFDIPSMYGVGMKFTPTSDVAILFDYTHINYSDIASIANPISNLTVGGNQLGTDAGGGFGWEDIDVFKLAVAWRVNPGLMLRAGWNHGDQPIPAGETLFNILAPATIEDHLTLGATWTLANNSELTVAYMHAFENEVNGSGSIPLGGGFPGGEADLKMSQDSIGVAYGYKF